jgi:hypothetical protein
MIAAGAAVVVLAGWYVRDPPLPDVRDWNIWDTGSRFAGDRVERNANRAGWVEDPRLRERVLAEYRDSLVADPAWGAYAAPGLGAALLLLGAPALRRPPAVPDRAEATAGAGRAPDSVPASETGG